jgi:hypothetical protein
MTMKASALAVGIALATTANATCPINECNYLDPQYKAVFQRWSACTGDYIGRIDKATNVIAALYPRFGLAYQAFMDEIAAETTAQTNGQQIDAATNEAIRQRFIDRVLRTAEPEAVQDFQLLQLQLRQHPIAQQCGEMPTPPRGQP